MEFGELCAMMVGKHTAGTMLRLLAASWASHFPALLGILLNGTELDQSGPPWTKPLPYPLSWMTYNVLVLRYFSNNVLVNQLLTIVLIMKIQVRHASQCSYFSQKLTLLIGLMHELQFLSA